MFVTKHVIRIRRTALPRKLSSYSCIRVLETELVGPDSRRISMGRPSLATSHSISLHASGCATHRRFWTRTSSATCSSTSGTHPRSVTWRSCWSRREGVCADAHSEARLPKVAWDEFADSNLQGARRCSSAGLVMSTAENSPRRFVGAAGPAVEGWEWIGGDGLCENHGSIELLRGVASQCLGRRWQPVTQNRDGTDRKGRRSGRPDEHS